MRKQSRLNLPAPVVSGIMSTTRITSTAPKGILAAVLSAAERKGLSKWQLALAAEKHAEETGRVAGHTSIYEWINGNREPRLSVIEVVFEVLGLSVGLPKNGKILRSKRAKA
jgi:hypothetical protein